MGTGSLVREGDPKGKGIFGATFASPVSDTVPGNKQGLKEGTELTSCSLYRGRRALASGGQDVGLTRVGAGALKTQQC